MHSSLCRLVGSGLLTLCLSSSMASASSLSSPGHAGAVSVVRKLYSFPAPLTNTSVATMVSLFAPAATLTVANYTGSIRTVHGRVRIGYYYNAFVGRGLGALETVRRLSRTTVIAYGRNQIPGHTVISRFAVVFVIKGGQIASEDEITFWRNPQ